MSLDRLSGEEVPKRKEIENFFNLQGSLGIQQAINKRYFYLAYGAYANVGYVSTSNAMQDYFAVKTGNQWHYGVSAKIEVGPNIATKRGHIWHPLTASCSYAYENGPYRNYRRSINFLPEAFNEVSIAGTGVFTWNFSSEVNILVSPRRNNYIKLRLLDMDFSHYFLRNFTRGDEENEVYTKNYVQKTIYTEEAFAINFGVGYQASKWGFYAKTNTMFSSSQKDTFTSRIIADGYALTAYYQISHKQKGKRK